MKDNAFRIRVYVDADTSVARSDSTGSDVAVRIENFCLALKSDSLVYCPLLETDFTTEGNHIGDSVPIHRLYDYGYIRIPPECQEIEISLAAILVDVATDNVLTVQPVKRSIYRHSYQKSFWW